MSSRILIKQLRELAAHVKKAAEWNASGLRVDAANDPYVYELLCYFTLCNEAAKHFRLKLIARYDPRTKKQVARWPKAPGDKANHSYFSLHDATGHCQFELCPGIKVADQYGQKQAADINLLRPSGTHQPTHNELLCIWDAKYRLKKERKITGPEIFDFIVTFEVLGSRKPPPTWSNFVGPAFRVSGLLTNGDFSTAPDPLLAARGVQETANFPANPATRPQAIPLPITRPAA